MLFFSFRGIALLEAEGVVEEELEEDDEEERNKSERKVCKVQQKNWKKI